MKIQGNYWLRKCIIFVLSEEAIRSMPPNTISQLHPLLLGAHSQVLHVLLLCLPHPTTFTNVFTLCHTREQHRDGQAWCLYTNVCTHFFIIQNNCTGHRLTIHRGQENVLLLLACTGAGEDLHLDSEKGHFPPNHRQRMQRDILFKEK